MESDTGGGGGTLFVCLLYEDFPCFTQFDLASTSVI